MRGGTKQSELTPLETQTPPDSTNKINAWSNLLSAIASGLKSFAPYLWALVIL